MSEIQEMADTLLRAVTKMVKAREGVTTATLTNQECAVVLAALDADSPTLPLAGTMSGRFVPESNPVEEDDG